MDLSNNILTILIWLPIFGGVAVLIAGDGNDSESSRAGGMRSLALTVSLRTLLLSAFATISASDWVRGRKVWISYHPRDIRRKSVWYDSAVSEPIAGCP